MNYNLKFSNEHEAIYFSNLRKYLKSDTAYSIMFRFQDLDSLKVLNKIRSNLYES